MPEVGLGIGRSQGILGGLEREVLSWFDEQGNRYPSAEEQAQRALIQVQQAQVQQAQVQQVQGLSRTLAPGQAHAVKVLTIFKLK